MYINTSDIQKSTGLDYHYILKAVKILDQVFTSNVVKRGSNNSLLFSSESAYTIFDKIKQLKDEGYSLKMMKPYFESTLNKNDSNQIQRKQNQVKTESIQILIEKLEESNKLNFETFNQLVKSKENEIKALESKITLLLPAGLSELDFQESQKSKDEKIVQLETELKYKDELISFLKEAHSRTQKIKPLILELQSLDGNLFSAGQRKKIFSDLIKLL